MEKNEIISKETLAQNTTAFTVYTPRIAQKAEGGQFVILRLKEGGERFPLTIADYDRQAQTITLVSLSIGLSTQLFEKMETGQRILDLAGPLGHPTHAEKTGTVVCIGGGVGIAAAHPVARALRDAGNYVISIIGARTKDLLFWEDKMAGVSDELIQITDDGSSGEKGFVTDALNEIVNAGKNISLVFAVGPTIMMRSVAKLTQPHQIKTVVSLNPIMVDGTGMCGGCRVQVGQKRKFVCVDGPDFDAHEVDFELLMARQRQYLKEEAKATEHYCQLVEREN